MRKWIVAVLMFAAIAAPSFAKDKLSYIDLVERLTNLKQLAVLPEPGERALQWSSWDRSSRFDESTNTYSGWDANGDGGGMIRFEGDQAVMAEMEGPGVIWRIWSAAPNTGHVRIYLDGAETPAVDLPFIAYFNGTTAPFNRSSLCYDAASGQNCYVPIPFQKSCKIIADKKWGNYYHFTYSLFPKETRVPTFSMTLTPEENAALDRVDAQLGAMGPIAPTGRDVQTIAAEVTVAPGETAEVAAIDGKRAIALLTAELDLPESPADRLALRELVLKMSWDGDAEPAVWAPFGDFFGTAPGANVYRSLPAGLTEDGLWYSNWYMPFARGAKIELANEGNEPRTVKFTIAHEKPFKSPKKLARYHAKWHSDAGLLTDPNRAIDWPMLVTAGKGRFCGVMLHVWNPMGGWWGEGDEKFFVDGERFPSTFGTGSEDYFGYAWGSPKLFARPFNNQTISENNTGHISVSRWHIADNVPYQNRFEGYIEKYFPNARPTLYDCVAYWYSAAGGSDPYEAVPLKARVQWPVPPEIVVEGALEGEGLEVLSKTAGETMNQSLAIFGPHWSRSHQLWWTGAKPGDELVLALPVEKAGKYAVAAQFTKARDFGIVQASLDGKNAGAPIDLFHWEVVPTGEVSLGTHKLKAGQHRLGLRIAGANKDATKSYFVGLDYVKLAPVK